MREGLGNQQSRLTVKIDNGGTAWLQAQRSHGAEVSHLQHGLSCLPILEKGKWQQELGKTTITITENFMHGGLKRDLSQSA